MNIGHLSGGVDMTWRATLIATWLVAVATVTSCAAQEKKSLAWKWSGEEPFPFRDPMRQIVLKSDQDVFVLVVSNHPFKELNLKAIDPEKIDIFAFKLFESNGKGHFPIKFNRLTDDKTKMLSAIEALFISKKTEAEAGKLTIQFKEGRKIELSKELLQK